MTLHHVTAPRRSGDGRWSFMKKARYVTGKLSKSPVGAVVFGLTGGLPWLWSIGALPVACPIVHPADEPTISLAADPWCMVGGETLTATVRLLQASPTDLVVSLRSESSNLSIPREVRIPKGAISVGFAVHSGLWGSGTALVHATMGRQTADLKIHVSPASGLADTAWPRFHGSSLNCSCGWGAIAKPVLSPIGFAEPNRRSLETSGLAIGIGGHLLVSAPNRLYELDPAVASPRWSYPISSVGCTPAVSANGTIYIGSADGSLVALLPGVSGSNQVRWRFKTGGAIESSPNVGNDGTIYFGSDDKCFYAVHPDGTLAWKFTTPGAVTSSPAILPDDGSVVFTAAGDLFAFTHDGHLKWQASRQFGSQQAQFVGSPAVNGIDGSIRVGDATGLIYAWGSDGNWEWSFPTGSRVVGSPTISSNGLTTYIGTENGSLVAFSSEGEQWRVKTGAPIRFAPTIGPSNSILVANDAGTLTSISNDGEVQWKIHSGSRRGPIIAGDGTLYVGNRTGDILAAPGNTQRMYVTDAEHGRIVSLDLKTERDWQALQLKTPVYPVGVEVDRHGKTYWTSWIGEYCRVNSMSGGGLVATAEPAFPSGILLDRLGRLLVTIKNNSRIVRMDDVTGKNLVSLGSPGEGRLQFLNPHGIAIDSMDRIYVCDVKRGQIIRFDDFTGKNWVAFGSTGKGINQFQNPTAICLDRKGRIYVADFQNARIVRFDDMDGSNWTEFKHSSDGKQRLALPAGIAIDAYDRIWVAQESIIRVDDMTGKNWTTVIPKGGKDREIDAPGLLIIR